MNAQDSTVVPWRDRFTTNTVLRAPEHKVYIAMQAEIYELRREITNIHSTYCTNNDGVA